VNSLPSEDVCSKDGMSDGGDCDGDDDCVDDDVGDGTDDDVDDDIFISLVAVDNRSDDNG
jgi:hypothetical protein